MSESHCTRACARRALLVTVLVIAVALPAAAASAWLAVALLPL